MHALHHLDRRSTLIATILAAALAIIATLVLATSLTDLAGSAAGNGRAGATLQSHATRAAFTPNLFTLNPLTHPLGAPIRLPWPRPTGP